jgi:hypothetical protein
VYATVTHMQSNRDNCTARHKRSRAITSARVLRQFFVYYQLIHSLLDETFWKSERG